jgi:hypothetical protein
MADKRDLDVVTGLLEIFELKPCPLVLKKTTLTGRASGLLNPTGRVTVAIVCAGTENCFGGAPSPSEYQKGTLCVVS